MSFGSKFRALALSGMLVSGCAGVQQAGNVRPAGTADPLGTMAPSENPLQRCQRDRRSGVQNCMVETISRQCTAANQGNEDGFYSCVANGLRTPDSAENRQVRVTVSQGDEVFGLRNATGTVTDVARLDASAIDANGVSLTFTIERIATSQPTVVMPVSHASMRMNFDGSRSGQWDMVSVSEVYVRAAESAPDGKATITFETANPRVFARSQ